MRSKFIEDILNSISEEDTLRVEKQMQESLDHHNWMKENGLKYCTDTSPSLKEVRAQGFNPIGITSFYLEETFIFKTKKEADEAFKKMEKESLQVSGWWYSKKDFEKELKESTQKGGHYENGHPQIYWL